MQERSELQEITQNALNQSDVKSTTVHLQRSLSKLRAEVDWPVKTAVASKSPRLTKIHLSKSQDLQLIGEVLLTEEDSFLAKKLQNISAGQI